MTSAYSATAKSEQFPAAAIPYSEDIVVVTANIITVNAQQPQVEAMAYGGGRIIALGSLAEVTAKLAGRDYRLDQRFTGKTIVPGFIEAHMHPILAAVFTAKSHYAGAVARWGNGGKLLPASPTLAALQQRLIEVRREHNAAGKRGKWINLWGVEPLLLGADQAINNGFIDALIDDSPVCLMHAGNQSVSLNSQALSRLMDNESPADGIISGLPNIFKVIEAGGLDNGKNAQEIALCLIEYSDVLHRLGVTTIADCGMGMPFNPYSLYRTLAKNKAFKLRLSAYPLAESFSVEALAKMSQSNSDRLDIGKVKYVRTDGSLQGETAHLLAGDYHSGRVNPAMIHSAETIYRQCIDYHRAGYPISFHCSGSGATEQLLEVIEAMQREVPRPGLRHCLEHNQMVTQAQLKRMKRLGVVHNLCANQLAIWGDLHASTTLGPERTAALNPFQSSVEQGVDFAIHSDDVGSQANPLEMMANAVSRENIFSGNVYGKQECLTPLQALHAVTLGPAILMGQQAYKGSLQEGKLADFAVLEQDPLASEPMAMATIAVVATAIGGEISVHSG